MPKSPIISIVTICYNDIKGLKNTFESVVNQTEFKHVEYIIIDGGSNDGTKAYLKENNALINYWQSKPDKGIWDAMNIGISKATGDYILFLNAGDYFYSNLIIKKVLASYTPNIDIFYGDTMFVNEAGEEIGLISKKTSKKLPAQLTYNDYINGMVVCHQSFIVRLNLITPYSSKFKYVADFDWMLNAVKKSTEIVNLNIVISNFLTGGFSTDNKLKSNIERLKILYKNFGLYATIKVQLLKILKNIAH